MRDEHRPLKEHVTRPSVTCTQIYAVQEGHGWVYKLDLWFIAIG